MTGDERRRAIALLLVEHEREGGDLAELLAGAVSEAVQPHGED